MDKIPGFSVGAGGAVSAMGKKVNRIKVDGVDIFGGNPKATLENIRSDMLKDIEVTNLAGETGSELEINLKLKKDKKEGIYGDVYGQYGTTSRRNFGLKINQIKPGTFLNGFLNYNNQNQQVLSPTEYLQLVGFNNASSGTLGTQKIYYDFKLEDPLDNLNGISERFPFLEKGIRQSYSAGFNMSKRVRNLVWDSYVLGSIDKSQIVENSNTVNYLGLFNSQELKNQSTDLRNLNATGQSNLKWTPSDKNEITAKLIIQKRNIDNNLSEVSNSSLTGQADTLVNNMLISNKQLINNKSTLGFFKANWEHRYQQPAVKTMVSLGSLVNSTVNQNDYKNQVNNGINAAGNHNIVDETNKNYNYFANIQHSFPLNRKLLLDFRINTLLSSNIVNRSTDGITNTGMQSFNNALSIGRFKVINNQTAIQSFLFYKSGSLSLIGGLGALTTDWKVSDADSLFNTVNRTSFLPALYVNYLFDRSKISFKYIKEQSAPVLSTLLAVTDSSRLQQVSRGNPFLTPFLSNRFELNTDIFVRGLGTINLSTAYLKTNGTVIDNYIYATGYFPIKTFDQYRNAQEITGTLSYFNFRPGRIFNPYFFVFYLWRKQYQQNGQTLSPVELSAVSPQVGLKMNINKEHSLNLSIQSVIDNSHLSGYQSSLTNRFNVDLKDDNKIANGLYYNFSAKWIMIYANSNYSYIKPVTNFNMYQYLGKEKKWQVNYGVRNLFNVHDINLVNVGITQRNVSSYNYLPRYFNLGVTYYPEKWKKSMQSNKE